VSTKSFGDLSRNLLLSVHSVDGCSIIEFTDADVTTLVAIEKTINPSPWSEENFRSSLSRRHLCIGIQREQEWLAYAVCSQVVDEAELLIIGVKKEEQGKGIGKALLTTLIELIKPTARTLFLEVRESNQAAINLYQSVGFNCAGQRPNYYPAKEKNIDREDALIFALELDF